MFDVKLWLLLVLITLPGIIVILPGSWRSMEKTIVANLKPGQAMPSRTVLLVASFAQSTLLSVLFAGLGTWLAPRVGVAAPFFTAIAEGTAAWPALQPQLLPALGWGVLGSLPFLLAYYGFFRPRLDAHTVEHMEGLRLTLGLPGRLLYGGIYEEVFTRWGLQVVFMWLFGLIAGGATSVTLWSAIVVTGLIFGALHLPSYIAAGSRPTPLFIAASLTLNLWASLIFGWLLWQHGLAAAMIGHMLFHLVWWPIDLRVARRPDDAAPVPTGA